MSEDNLDEFGFPSSSLEALRSSRVTGSPEFVVRTTGIEEVAEIGWTSPVAPRARRQADMLEDFATWLAERAARPASSVQTAQGD